MNKLLLLLLLLLPYLRLTVKIFQFSRLSTEFLAVLRLSVNPIKTLLHTIQNYRHSRFASFLSLTYSVIHKYLVIHEYLVLTGYKHKEKPKIKPKKSSKQHKSWGAAKDAAIFITDR